MTSTSASTSTDARRQERGVTVVVRGIRSATALQKRFATITTLAELGVTTPVTSRG